MIYHKIQNFGTDRHEQIVQPAGFKTVCHSIYIFWMHYMSLVTRKPVFGVSDKVRLKPAAQPQRLARGFKFRI